MKKKIVLVHGYNKKEDDMLTLKLNLEQLNYEGILVSLPLTFKSINSAFIVFEKIMKEIITKLNKNEKINFVGHSTGGLIIREFLATTKYKDNIGRAVLIATPNQGSKLADLGAKLSKLFTNIFKTVNSLQTTNIKQLNLTANSNIEIGAIAGSKSNLILGRLLANRNDGRIEVDSVKYKGLKDFIILPYGHKEIHYQLKTAKLVDKFIKDGQFK